MLIRLERFTSFSLSMAHIFTLALMLFVFMMFDCVKHEQHSLLPYPCSLSSLKPPKHGRAPAAATAEKNSTRTHTRLRYEYVYISRSLSLRLRNNKTARIKAKNVRKWQTFAFSTVQTQLNTVYRLTD